MNVQFKEAIEKVVIALDMEIGETGVISNYCQYDGCVVYRVPDGIVTLYIPVKVKSYLLEIGCKDNVISWRFPSGEGMPIKLKKFKLVEI